MRADMADWLRGNIQGFRGGLEHIEKIMRAHKIRGAQEDIDAIRYALNRLESKINDELRIAMAEKTRAGAGPETQP